MNSVCVCCECDPCDCHGMNDEKKELWGMGQDTSDQRRKNHGLDVQGSGGQPVHPNQVETGGNTQHRILFQGLCCTCQYSGQAHLWDNTGRGQDTGDRTE